LQKALAVAYGFENMSLDGPSTQYRREQKAKGEEEDLYIDLWPVQIQSPEADQSHAWDTYTMILQLGTILSMTGSWKNHKLRVSVFVEFEQEIEEERRRVRSLLDNLRVPASLRVFSLSAEQVTSYACIVRGKEPVPKPIEIVLAGDPWWEMLKSLRKEEERRQHEKAEKRKSNAQPVPGSSSSNQSSNAKRQSKRDQKLLGVSLPKEHLDFFQHNMQIGLAHPRAGRRARRGSMDVLGKQMPDNRMKNLSRRSRSESESESETSASDSDSDSDLSDELARLDLDDIDFLSSSAGSNNNGLRRAQTYSTGGNQTSRGQRNSSNMRRRRGSAGRAQRTRTYEGQMQRDLANVGSYGSLSSTPRPSTFRNSTIHEVAAAEEEASDPDGTLRASDRARIQAALQQKPKVSSRNTKDGTPPTSRPRSMSSVSDISIHDDEEGAGRKDCGENRFARSYHETSMVTFNQLPNKAQYLILNELIRTNSSASTSVVLTALPAPEVGTSQDANRSLRYLQHLENLFSGGPPVLGVHAKQLTMTSAL
jgi:solute carrier family 12 (potassium/chloride transporters), member 9